MKYYLDSSFIVDCVFRDSIARSILNSLDGLLFTSKLGRVETIRTIQKIDSSWLEDAHIFLEGLISIELSDEIFTVVESYGPEITLKTADAIHLATASIILDADGSLVTLDKQMTLNAKKLGVKVISL